MYKNLVCLLFLAWLGGHIGGLYGQKDGAKTADYPQIFGEDYQKAVAFVTENKPLINASCKKYNIAPLMLMSVVFPELIRYNAFRDFFEAGALEYAYVYGGTSAADFSIGFFQIKPSFVEQLENLVKKNASSSWAAPFVSDFEYSMTEKMNPSFERQRRHERLQSTDWQLKYVACFYKYVSHKFSAHLNGKSEIVQLQFLATAYNAGFNRSVESLQKCQSQRFFPHGITYPQKDQYSYADVSKYAYLHTLPKLLGK
jgi:hypothetical protein